MAHATIRDVARRAQVSVASVSRALNGSENVSPETRDRVVAAATALGYVPHAGARSLSLARSHTIGVVLPDLHGEFFSECVRGMDREASRRGYVLLLSNMHDDGEAAALALRAMRGRVDGLLVMAPHIAPAVLDRALPASIPAVLINCASEDVERPALRLDNRAGATAMVRHLIDNGYRRIVHVAGPEGNVDAEERAEGYRSAVAELAPGMESVIYAGNFSEEGGEAAVRRMLAAGPMPDAIFASNDMTALGCLTALKSAGLAVPQQVAVAGFDDVPLAKYLSVSTMRVRIAEIGERAVARLIDRLEGRAGSTGIEWLTPELIARATTAARGSEHQGDAP